MPAPKARSPAETWLLPGGLAAIVAGFAIAAYAFTGEQAYDVTYFWVALAGIILILGGGIATGVARVLRNRPASARARAGAAKSVPVKPAKPARGSGGAGVLSRFRKPVASASNGDDAPSNPLARWRRGSAGNDGDADMAPVPVIPAPNVDTTRPVTERVTVACPRCGEEFREEGTRPITLKCPSCALTGEIA